MYPSTLGATNAPFVHPGHALTIVLNEDEASWTGGFSLAPNGNDIAITFRSLFGTPVPLAARRATTTTASSLTFTFPDSLQEIGRTVSGPVEVRVTAAGRMVAWIRADDLVGLPPTTDVTAIVLGTDAESVVLATLGSDGDLWIPVGFHGDPNTMPMCPGEFLSPLPVYIGGAMIDGALAARRNPLDRIRGIVGYLGDFHADGLNYYGMLWHERINLVHQDGTLGVSICRLNDAVELVLRVRGDRAWARARSSPFRLAAKDSAPIPLRLLAAPLCPSQRADQTRRGHADRPHNDGNSRDSFDNPCAPGTRN